MGLFAGGRPDVLMGEFTVAMSTGVLVDEGMKVVFILRIVSVMRRMVETLPSLIIKVPPIPGRSLVVVVVEVLVREILPR